MSEGQPQAANDSAIDDIKSQRNLLLQKLQRMHLREMLAAAQRQHRQDAFQRWKDLFQEQRAVKAYESRLARSVM